MKWPQIAMLIILSMEFFFSFMFNGRSKQEIFKYDTDKISFKRTAFTVALLLFLLYMGGFFNAR